MKLLLLSLLALNFNHAKANYLKAIYLKMNCEAEAKITQTFSTTYHPEVPPQGRFPGFPAYTSAEVEIEFIAFSPACDDLLEAYDVTLPTTVKTTMTYGLNFRDAKLGVLKLKLEQVMPSVQGLLPLYPHFHSEELSLVGENGLKVNLPYDFFEQYDSYNLDQVEDFSDEVKLQLTQKILEASLDLYQGKKGFQKVNFAHSYSSTMFDQYLPTINDAALLKEQAKLYIAYLDKLKALNPKARYFRFHVGGAGGQVMGALISNMIEKGAIEKTIAIDLVKKYPALLSLYKCPLAESSQLLEFLNYVKTEIKDTYFYEDAVQSLTSGWYSSCGLLKTPEINALAAQILVEIF